MTSESTTKAADSTDKAAEAQRRLNAELKQGGIDAEDQGNKSETAGKKTSGAGALIAGAIEGWTGRLKGMSQAAADAFSAVSLGISKPTTEIEGMTQRIGVLNDSIKTTKERALSLSDTSGLQRFFGDLRISATETEVAYLKQKIAFDSLMESYQSGSISAQTFASRANQARNSLELLNKSDLSTLESAVSSAKQQMESLQDSTRSTVNSLRSELDRLRGDDESAAIRSLKAREDDLQRTLDNAQDVGDGRAIRNAKEGLRLAKSITTEKKRQLQEEEQIRRANESQVDIIEGSTVQADTTTQAAPVKAPTPVAATVITLVSGNKSVDVSTDSQQDLIEVLESAGLRSS